MRQINCYIPIKLCITGRPSDAQLDQLGEELVRALAARISFAERTLSEHGIISRNDWRNSELVAEPFESTRWTPATETYFVPSYKDAGTATPVRTKKRKPLRMQVRLTEEIREAVNDKILEQPLDLSFIADQAMISAWREELVIWTYARFFTPEKPLKDRELQKLLKQIEKAIVVPLLHEQFRDFYENAGDPYHILSLAPEVEFAAFPKEVRDMIAGGLHGWLDIREEIAARLAPEFRSNLLRFFGMAPEGKMAQVKIWPGRGTVLVHEDLVPLFQSIFFHLTTLAPILEDQYPEFWRRRSSLGLQIRHVKGSDKLSAHTLGKAIDTVATYNPHIKDPRLLTIINFLSGIDTVASVRGYGKRRALIEKQRENLLAGKEMSGDFKAFLLDAEDRYREWEIAQKKFRSSFPKVARGADLPVALGEIIQRVENERDKIRPKVEKALEDVSGWEERYHFFQEEKKLLNDAQRDLHKEVGNLGNQAKQLQRKWKRTLKSVRTIEQEKELKTAQEQLAGAVQRQKEVRARLKELRVLLNNTAKQIKHSRGAYAKIQKEYDFLDKLVRDLTGDDDLLFKEEVVDPGLNTLNEQGFLSIPWEVIRIFLEHGFDWGGLWQAPDFMHFEYAGKVSGEV